MLWTDRQTDRNGQQKKLHSLSHSKGTRRFLCDTIDYAHKTLSIDTTSLAAVIVHCLRNAADPDMVSVSETRDPTERDAVAI